VTSRQYHGKGVSTDIIEAAALAYLQALNKADHDRRTQIPQNIETQSVKP
jgi:2-isopropylmalate synthase